MRRGGRGYDAEPDPVYNYFRDYDPAIGRYTQSDPIGLDGGLNTYAYVGGDPLSYFDDDGLHPSPGRGGGNRGERGRTRNPSGTANPNKHIKPHPTDPGKVVVKDPHTGKSHERPRKPGDPPPKDAPPAKSEACGDECEEAVAEVVVVAGVIYIVYRCVRMIPSVAIPPLWPTIPVNAAIP